MVTKRGVDRRNYFFWSLVDRRRHRSMQMYRSTGVPHWMYSKMRGFAAPVLAVALVGGLVQADEVTEEPWPSLGFPAEVSVRIGETPTQLALTGTDVLRKYFVDVYWVAHYMEDPPDGSGASIIETVLTDGSAKQIILQFVRDVKAKRLQRGVREDLRRSATDAELSEMAPIVERFVNAVKDAQTDDRFILRWLPGGQILAAYRDEVVFDVTNLTFARVLWSIWFGEKAIVEPEALVRLVSTES